MTLEELQEHWQEYMVQVHMDIPELNRHIEGKIILKEKFFVCFLEQKENALFFDPGGHDPRCVALRPDEEGNCYMRFPSGRWIKIGKFVRIEQ
jgi:hypothetical protein